jgi:RNA polymerase sigma-70 factor (ECF subfamily)
MAKRRLTTGLGAVALVPAVVAVVGLSAGRAEAHTGYALPPATNLRTSLLKVVVPVAGVEASSVDLGDQLELRGVPARDLIVLGYQDEPFVRSAPDGVYVNARAPSLGGDPDHGDLERDPDPAATPEWVLVGGPGLVRWHDHRSHWMGVDDPPAAAAQPERAHVIVESWTVPLVAGSDRGEISGDLRWEPPPAPWPSVLLATASLVAVLIPALLGRSRRSVLAASIVLAASTLVVITGWVIDGGATAGQVIGGCLPAAVGVALLGMLTVGARSSVNRAVHLVVGLTAVALVVVPVAPLVVSAPFGSQLASSWNPVLVRAAAAMLAGSAAGLAFALSVPLLAGAPPAGGPRRVARPPLLRRRPSPGRGTSPRITTTDGAATDAATTPASSSGPARGPARDSPAVASGDELTEVARRAAGGDREALEDFVRRTQPDVWRLCRYLVDEQAADDLTAEVYEHVLRALPSFEGRAPARAWLLTIARRRCADEIRRRGRSRRADARLGPGPSSVAARDGEIAVTDALDRLGEERRTAFVLTQLLGLSYQEAADVIGCPIGTIRSRVARARADLIDAVGPAVDDVNPPRGWAPGDGRAFER